MLNLIKKVKNYFFECEDVSEDRIVIKGEVVNVIPNKNNSFNFVIKESGKNNSYKLTEFKCDNGQAIGVFNRFKGNTITVKELNENIVKETYKTGGKEVSIYHLNSYRKTS